LSANDVEFVYSLIMATRHGEQPQESTHQWVVDIDLAILGAEPERFKEYEKQVRQEYKWVP
jgi:predicted metal-dependent HD superfamily phosphohydrolase